MDARELLSIGSATAHTIQSEQPAEEAARMMIARKFSALVVLDPNGKLVGILSDHDVVKGMDRLGCAVAETPVTDLCTARVISCSSDDSVVELMQIMNSNEIPHVPVIDGDEVLGIIGILQVMNAWMGASENEIQRLQDCISA